MWRNRTDDHKLLWLCLLLTFLVPSEIFCQSLNVTSHSLTKRQVDENKRVVCYFANWAVYRSGAGKFSPQNINPYLCTHLIYAFGGLGKDDTIQPFDKYQDLEKGGYGQFAALKTYNRDLKTLLAIGGWNEGSRRFSPLVADPARRKTFIRSAVRFLRQYNFDGLDLDWEYPAARDGGKPEDRKNYAIFVKEMREAFEQEAEKTGKSRLMITMAVPASLEYAAKGFDIASLDKSLDFFNLLTYDYHSSYEPATNHHSPLFRPADVSEFDFRADLNIDSTVKFYIDQGASRNKLVLGIPTYGRSFTLVNPDAHAIGSPTDGPGEKGKFTKEDGYLAYYEVCEGVEKADWEVITTNPGEVGPYAHKDNFWVGYDDEDMVREKSHYVVEEGMGGIMFWTIDNDDFRGACGPRPFPLIESAKEALYGKEGTFKTATSVSVSTSEQTRIERLRLSQNQIAQLSTTAASQAQAPPKKGSSSATERTLERATQFGTYDPFSTPEPPTTPSNEPGYQCKDEGFFPHTTNCKKYFWCLEVPGTGMVAHTFTCPQGLYFNSLTDGCDFRRNVDCESKSDDEVEESSPAPFASTTESSSEEEESGNKKSGDKKEPKTLEEVLAAIKEAGGIDEFEEKIRKEEEAKKESIKAEEERRQEITNKTRSRLSKLLDKKRAEAHNELTKPEASVEASSESSNVVTSAPSSNPEAPRSRLRNNNRPSFKPNLSRTRESSTQTQPEEASAPASEVTSAASGPRSLLRSRERFRSNLSSPSTSTTSSSPPPTTQPEAKNSIDESVTKIEIIGAEENIEGSVTLRPNRFRPEAGVRDRLRTALHETLDEVDENQAKAAPAQSQNENQSSTRIEPIPFVASHRQRVPATERPGAASPERYVTIQRGPASTPAPSGGDQDQSDKVNKVGSNHFNEKFRENFYANRIRRDVEPVSIILPATSLNSDILYVQSILPELPQESGIAYIYPDNLNIRENRQTSFVVPETTTAALQDFSERLDNKEELSINNEVISEDIDNTVKPERSAANFETEVATEIELIAEPTTTTTTTTTTTATTTIEDKPEENEHGDETNVDAEKSSSEEDEIISVSVSKSMSEAFSIPEVVTGIVEFFTSTFAPTTSEPDNGDSEPSTEQLIKVETESTTASTTTTTTTTSLKTEKGRTSIFTGKRAHPFLASKTSSPASTTESAPSSSTLAPTRKPFFRQKTIADLNSSTGEHSKKNKTEANEPQISNEIIKPEKKNNLLNARPRFNILAKKLSNENETTTTTTSTAASTAEEVISTEDSTAPVSDAPIEVNEVVKEEAIVKEVVDVADGNKVEVDDKEETVPKVEAKTSSPILIKNKLRPKFQVPKSLQGRLIDHVVAEKEDKNEVEDKVADEKPAKEFKATTSAPKSRSPLRQRQQSRFSAAPATSTELPVVIKSISPRSRGRIRPDRPLDLSPSPSQTVTRTRPSSSSFKSKQLEDIVDVTTSFPKAHEESTTTEKITVAKVLATLHGEQEPEQEASTLRPHSFKPKLGSASRDKLREKLREHLSPEDHLDAAGEIFEDEHHEPSLLQKQKETRVEDRTAPKVAAAPEFTPSRANSGQARRVARPRTNKQQLKISPVDEEKPRSGAEPILTAPRRRQRPQPGTKIKPEHSAESVPAPIGGRLLSDADLMTGLGFNKKEEPEEKPFEFIPTPSAPLIGPEEEEEIHSDLEAELNLDEEKEDVPLDEPIEIEPFAGPYVPTIEDILKSAIVDSNVPISKDVVLESSTPAALPAPEVQDIQVLPPAPEVSLEKVVPAKKTPLRSRAQLPLRHRLESGHHNQESVPSRSAPQSNLIESKRVRSRQRVTVVPANSPIEAESEKSEPLQEETEVVPKPITRQVTRVRKPIRTQTTRVSQVHSEAHASSPRARANSNNNNRPITRVNNNRLRVRGGSRSTTTAPTDIVVITDEEKALDDGSLTLTGDSNAPVLQEDTNEAFVPDYDIGNIIGKFDSNEGDTNDNTDRPEAVLTNEDEESILYPVSNELGGEEKEEEIEEDEETKIETIIEETSSVRNFQPRFGEKQRQSVRSKLKSHLFEQAPSSKDSVNEIKESEIEEENTKQNEEPFVEQVPEDQFQSVSPSEGLSALPASFFTTTSRFELLSESSIASFLPTQKPQTRVGRSTVGYRNTVNDVTDKPSLFSKVGISEHSVRDELVVTTTPTMDFTTTLLDEVLTTTTNENSVGIDDIPNPSVEIGSRLYKRKKVDLLSKLSEKYSDREEKERKLLNSFAESHTRITTKFPVDDKLITLSTNNPEESTSKSPALSSFLRPRRKFELGFKDLKTTVVESSTPKSEDSFENSTQIGDNDSNDVIATTTETDTFSTTTTISSNITDSVADHLSFVPTPRPFPKDLKLPFGKKNNDRFKPILLSFKVEKKPVRQNITTSEDSGNNINSTISLPETTTTTTAATLDEVSLDSEQTASASKISSLKKKFQFGRKAFGKLVGSKGSTPENSSPPPSPSSSTSSPSTLSTNPDPIAPDVLLVPGYSQKVF